MAYKNVCFNCQRASKRTHAEVLMAACAVCGGALEILFHHFRAPQRAEAGKWETVRFLIANGFRYQPIVRYVDSSGQPLPQPVHAEYPDNLPAARHFIEEYKDQALK